jgi:hypothetical protein
MEIVLDGWSVGASSGAEWIPWGSGGNARARVLAAADGYSLVVVDADAGYVGSPHRHERTEFLYVLEGSLHNQGSLIGAGGGYVASAGTVHADFGTATGARYLSIFGL